MIARSGYVSCGITINNARRDKTTNQATDITDYELDTGESHFTVTALTEPPADNVTFVIV